MKDTLNITHPELCKEWDYEKNQSRPNDYTHGSKKKVWWVCSKCESSWETNISNRTVGKGCPYCSGRKVNGTNCLANVNPDLARQWHPEKNENLTPYDVTSKSGKKVWWICEKDHEWIANISARAKGNGCPYCAGQKATKENNITVTHPLVAAEWNKEKNNIDLLEIMPNTNRKVWWQCSNGHEWEATPYSRTSMKTRCPYCTSFKASNENNLLVTYPLVAMQWDYEENGNLTPTDVTHGSGKMVWWKCNFGHKWSSTIHSRTTGGVGCPYCSGRYATEDKNLAFSYPHIAKLWDSDLNRDSPTNIPPRSGKTYWWKCDVCSVRWQSTVANMTSSIRISNRCLCSDGVKYPEKFTFSVLMENDIFSISQKTFEWSLGRLYDFYLPEHNWIVEIHGGQHYAEAGFEKLGGRTLAEEQENDRLKEKMARDNGIDKYIVIRADVSDPLFLKDQFMKSELKEILKEDISWENIYRNAEKSYVRKVWNMWDNGKSIEDILKTNEIPLSKYTIQSYLKRGRKIGIID